MPSNVIRLAELPDRGHLSLRRFLFRASPRRRKKLSLAQF